MLYTIALRSPPETARPPHLIFGVPADSFFRIAAPVTMGLLSATGLVYAVRGKQNVASYLALTGLIMSSLVAAGQALVLEEERGRL